MLISFSVFIGGALYQKQGFLQSTLPTGLFLATRIFFLVGNSTRENLLCMPKQNGNRDRGG
jgi:hypothetical protein